VADFGHSKAFSLLPHFYEDPNQKHRHDELLTP